MWWLTAVPRSCLSPACAVDSGPVCCRVRCGPMVLPLFRKPVDTSLKKLKRLNSKGPALHLTVRGVE